MRPGETGPFFDPRLLSDEWDDDHDQVLRTVGSPAAPPAPIPARSPASDAPQVATVAPRQATGRARVASPAPAPERPAVSAPVTAPSPRVVPSPASQAPASPVPGRATPSPPAGRPPTARPTDPVGDHEDLTLRAVSADADDEDDLGVSSIEEDDFLAFLDEGDDHASSADYDEAEFDVVDPLVPGTRVRAERVAGAAGAPRQATGRAHEQEYTEPEEPVAPRPVPDRQSLADLLAEVSADDDADDAEDDWIEDEPPSLDDPVEDDEEPVDLLSVWRPEPGAERVPPPIDEAAIARLLEQQKAGRGKWTEALLRSVPRVDEEVPDAPLAKEERQGEEWEPAIAVSASQASFAAPSALSLISSNLQQDHDELNDALAAFAALRPGQKAFIRTTFRTYPEARGEISAWVQATKTGETPKGSASGAKLVAGWLGYAMSYFVHAATGASAKGRPKPQPPHKRGKDVKPIATSMMADETKQAIKEAELKGRDPAHYEVALRIGVVGLPDQLDDLEGIRKEIETGFDVYATGHQRIQWDPCDGRDAVIGFMPVKQSNDFVLSSVELGEVARVPDDLTRPGSVIVARARVKPLSPPNPIVVPDPLNPPKGIIPVGVINPNTEDQLCIGMRNQELDKHLFGVGRTGSGKSVWLQYVVHGIAKADYPIVIIDPHGTFAEDIKYNIILHCPERIKDLVFVDCSDPSWPMAFNPLDVQSGEEIEPTVHSVMEMLERQMQLSGSGAPRAVVYAQEAITALCEANLALKDPETKCTMLHVVSFFLDDAFRHLVLQACSNPALLEKYDPDTGSYEALSERQRVEHIGPILRAFQPLGTSEAFANVFASGENRLNFTKLILDNKIIILKLARFSHQKELASFVGALTIPYLLQSMNDWGRTQDPDTKVWKGRGCRLIIDEAPTVCGPKSSIVQVAAEARKWDLGFLAMSQFPQQFDKEVEKALYVNTASKVSLVLDSEGVGGMANSIDGGRNLITKADLINLPNYYAYANLLLASADGREQSNSGPFSMATLPPMIGGDSISDEHRRLASQVMDRSHALVCNQRSTIQAKRRELTNNLKIALTRYAQENISAGPSMHPAAGAPVPSTPLTGSSPDAATEPDPFAAQEMDDGDLFDPRSYQW